MNLPLASGIMLLRTASLYMLMLTLGSRRSDRSVLRLVLFMFMMKFEFSSPFCIIIRTFQQGKIDSPKILDYMLINKFISAYIHIWFS